MKILQLCLSPGKGGLELYYVKLLKWLQSEGLSYHGAVLKNSYSAGLLDAGAIRATSFSPLTRQFPWMTALKLARLMEREEIDILHMHWNKDLPLAVMAKLFSKRPVKLVYIRQMEMVSPKKDPYHRVLYGQVDAFIVITRALLDSARRYLPIPQERINLLYYGVPEGRSLPAGERALFYEKAFRRPGSFKVALFGRIEEGKGQHLLVEAVRALVAEGRDLEALLIGHVVDERHFSALMTTVEKAGLKDRIHYYGFHPDPTSVMGLFDAVVLASYCETFGLVLIEAMRAGTAVIGSRAGGVPEIIDDGETGLLFEPRSAGSLAAALKKLIHDPALRNRMAGQGKAKADSLFSEERHFAGLRKIYTALSPSRP